MSITKKPYKIGFLLNKINSYTYILCKAVLEKSENLGLDVNILTITQHIDKNQSITLDSETYYINNNTINKILSLLLDLKLDALIINTCVLDFVDVSLLKKFLEKNQNLPVISIGLEIDGASVIRSNNYLSGCKAIEHLIDQQQCKNIVYIRGPKDNIEAEERYQSYIDTLKKYNLPVNSSHVF